MKTLNFNNMKKTVLGIIMTLAIGFSSFANYNTEIETSNEMTEEYEVVDSWMTDLSSWSSLKSSGYEVDMEEEVELEAWMINLDSEVWCSDREDELEIEDWMTSIANNFLRTEDPEEELPLEEWMLNYSEWLK
jgi:hypothetical protein